MTVSWPVVFRDFVVVAVYTAFLWRAFRDSGSNRFVPCGILMIVAAATTAALVMKVPSFPYWLFQMLLILILVLMVLTIVFGVQRLIGRRNRSRSIK